MRQLTLRIAGSLGSLLTFCMLTNVATANHLIDAAGNFHQSAIKLEVLARNGSPSQIEYALAERLVRKACALEKSVHCGNDWSRIGLDAEAVRLNLAMLQSRLTRYCPSDVPPDFQLGWQCVTQDWERLARCLAQGVQRPAVPTPALPLPVPVPTPVPPPTPIQPPTPGLAPTLGSGFPLPPWASVSRRSQRPAYPTTNLPRGFDPQGQLGASRTPWDQGRGQWDQGRGRENPFASNRGRSVQQGDLQGIVIQSLLRHMFR